MFSLNIITKLARSRSQVSLVTRTFKTSSPLWRENREGPDKSKHCQQPAGSKIEDDCPLNNSKTQQKSCCQQDDSTNFSKKQLKITKHCQSESNKYSESKKQEEISSCGPIEISNEGLEGKSQRTCKPPGLETNERLRSRGCSCPPFDTPKIAEERGAKKEQKPTSTKRCPESYAQQRSKEREECVSEQIRVNARESGKPKYAQEENQYGNSIQERSEPCGSTNLSRKNKGPQENENFMKDKNLKKSCYCGPDKMSYKDSCQEDITVRSNSYNKTRKETVTSSHSTCSNPGNDCEVQSDTCGPTKPSTKILCPEENESANIVKQFRLDPCKTLHKSECPEVQEKDCLDEQNLNICHEDSCKEEIKIPELPPCCKVDAAKECICKLKNLQREWEEVIMVQEGKGKDECPKFQELGMSDQGQSRKKAKQSDMIYVVLVGVVAAVLYYTYNSDFEYDELFLDQKELEENFEDNNDDD